MAYAGTIRDVDLERGAFVLNDVGPRLASTPAPVSARTIALTPGTVIVEAQRAQDSDSGFPGDYATTVTTRAELDEGEFVAVECEPGGVTCEAVEITLVRTDRAG
jgi:hypothetical protein